MKRWHLSRAQAQKEAFRVEWEVAKLTSLDLFEDRYKAPRYGVRRQFFVLWEVFPER